MTELDNVPMPAKEHHTPTTAENVKTVLIAVVIALVVRSFAFEPFNIPSGSMIPTLLVGDYLFVSKFSYGYSRYSLPLGLNLFQGRILAHLPERGDVAVFRNPKEVNVDFIKRIVGLPGDHIQMIGGILHINGVPVKRDRITDYADKDRDGVFSRSLQYEETLPNGKQHPIIEYYGDNGPADNTQDYVVPEDHYFMMGDNRDNSSDSRFLDRVGYVPFENLVGKAQFLFFSWDNTVSWWQVWKWPTAIRYGRLLNSVE